MEPKQIDAFQQIATQGLYRGDATRQMYSAKNVIKERVISSDV